MKHPLIYFDNAATTPIFPEVAELMHQIVLNNYGNPSSLHEPGRKAKAELERARRQIAGLLKARPEEFFFTSGGTEANNAVLWGCFKHLNLRRFISTPLEHPSVIETLRFLEKKMECSVQYLQVNNKGIPDLAQLESFLASDEPALVILMHANNETGNLLSVGAAGSICKKYGALLHSDIVQTVGKTPIDFTSLPFDFAAFSAHKFHGPKGVGAMYIRSGLEIEPLITGGAQERNMRAGTENVAGVAGMAKALEICSSNLETTSEKIIKIRDFLMETLPEEIPGLGFNGDPRGASLHTILNVTLPRGIDAEMLLPRLDLSGICVSTGSACSSGSTKPSPVLTAMGVDSKSPNLRLSFGCFNTLEEAQRLVEVLKDLYK